MSITSAHSLSGQRDDNHLETNCMAKSFKQMIKDGDPINFPTPFAQVYVCFGNKITANSVDGDGNAAGACAISLTQYKVFNDSNTFGATIHWMAIGKAPGY